MTDYDTNQSRAVYELEGWVQESIDHNNFTRATDAEVTTEADLKYDEMLFANIINLDAWLHEEWDERIASEIDLDDDRIFIVDFNEATVRLHLRTDEVVEAAEQRAGEDATEAAYVLGSWVYLAKKADHIPSCTTLKAAYERVADRDDQPDDSTTEEYRGGQDGW